MTATATERNRRRKVTASCSITLEQDAVLCALADLRFGSNRSAALQFLIDTYAGKAVERERQAREEMTETALEPIARWKAPKLSSELIGAVWGLVRAGNMPETACEILGISPKQRTSWLKLGRNDRREGRQSLHADFVAAVARAEAECEAEDIKRLREHGQATWTALAWRLERQYPDRYAQRKRIDGKVQHSLVPLIDYDRLSASETRTLVELLRKASPEGDDPSVGRASRPAIELVPEDVLDVVDGEWTEAPALEGEALALEAPAPATEAPGLDADSAEAPVLEAPALGGPPASDQASIGTRSDVESGADVSEGD